MKIRHYLMILLSGAALYALSSCEKKTPEEKAAEDMEDAAEEVGDAIKDAGDEMGDAIEDATGN